ncbi:hypothetical protein AMTR_s00015p00095820 [Amborella trichopoda]|uniref:Uncharacterized protein n=1 Tax=Amborella trichopoda TaxID=13333 RepID=W1PM47_AMBTC|nr:hypothetical protein AMTR_s00015p00095820 [Amborella trichopoda]
MCRTGLCSCFSSTEKEKEEVQPQWKDEESEVKEESPPSMKRVSEEGKHLPKKLTSLSEKANKYIARIKGMPKTKSELSDAASLPPPPLHPSKET